MARASTVILNVFKNLPGGREVDTGRVFRRVSLFSVEERKAGLRSSGSTTWIRVQSLQGRADCIRRTAYIAAV